MAIASYDDLETAFRGLAFHKLDVAADFVDSAAHCLLAHLPGATFRLWESYAEAVENHWQLRHGGDVPDSYLDDELKRAPRDTWREMAISIQEDVAADCLKALLAHYPKLRAVAS